MLILRKQTSYFICFCLMFSIITPSIALGNYSHEHEFQDTYAITEGRFIDFFPDENLAAGIVRHMRGVNGTPQDIVTVEELNNYTHNNRDLELTNRNIYSLEGMQHLTSIKQINLSDNNISDISPLSNLTGLNHLHLRNNQISDISPLSNLTGLNSLILNENQISDISPLSNLTGLNHLHLRNNQISDISPLSNLTGLNSLILSENQISDISGLGDNVLLTTLDLSNNNISDISLFSTNEFGSFWHLKLNDNNISDISALSNVRHVTNLHLRNNQISDITPISHMTTMVTLDLCSNEISDISPLSNFEHLISLQLNNNKISDISPIAGINLRGELSVIDQEIVLEPITFGESVQIHIRNKFGVVPFPITFSPNEGSYDPENDLITWGGTGINTLQWNDGRSNFSGTITQQVNQRDVTQEKRLIFSEDFENGLGSWIVSNPGTNNPRIEVDAQGNHYLRAENGERATHAISLPPNTRIRMYCDMAGIPELALTILQLNHGELPVVIHEESFSQQNLTTIVSEFTTPDDTSNFFVSLESRGLGWANFDNIRVYEVIEN